MKNPLKILTLLCLLILAGCSEDDSQEETPIDSSACTEWNNFNSACLSSLPNGTGSFEAGIRSRACVLSETDDVLTLNVIVEPINGGISDNEEYEGIKITYTGGTQIELSKSDFNNGGTIERTIEVLKANYDQFVLDNFSSASASLFVNVECVTTVVQNDRTVQELIDDGVSFDDIINVHGYFITDIYGKKYLDGIIIFLQRSSNSVIGGTVMAPQDHPQELSWDDALALYPDSGLPSSDGQWSIPRIREFQFMISNIVASTETHPSWIRPNGYYWTAEEVNDGFGTSAVGYYVGASSNSFNALKFRENKIRIIKNF